MITKEMLKQFVEDHGDIRIGLAGAGYMARNFIIQVSYLDGVRICAMASKTRSKVESLVDQYMDYPVDIFDSINELANTDVEIIVDLTGSPEGGASLSEKAILNGKHVVSCAEMGSLVGPVIAELAREKKVLFSDLWGDEPGLIKSLYDYAQFLGFEIIAAGKFKGFYDPMANPDSVAPFAIKANQNPVMIASFADGSKLSMEMTVVANATGLTPDVRGMHLPKGKLADICELLKLKSEGGILSRKGVIEVVQGVEPSGGVFAIVRTDNPETISSMRYCKMGSGPNYMLYIPYHIPGVEMIHGVVEMLMYNRSIVEPLGKPVADVMTFAKRDLVPGQILEDVGGFDYYGIIEDAKTAVSLHALPLGMAPEAKMLRSVKKGQMITMADVEVRNHPTCMRLRKRYDEMVLDNER